MKNLFNWVILFSISPLVFAQGGSLETATRNILTVGEVAERATTPSSSCADDPSLHHGRRRLDNDSTVPVLKCPPPSTSERIPAADVERFLTENNVSIVPVADRTTIVASDEVQQFVHEARKFPSNLMRQMKDRGARIVLIRGNGVSEDPGWEAERQRQVDAVNNSSASPEVKAQRIAEINRGYSETFEAGGRSWSYTSGAGGNFSNPNWIVPTRIVVNHMYSTDVPIAGTTRVETREEGSVNLFLHEHGHALDNFHGPGTISNSQEWRDLRNDPANAAYLRKIFTSYEFDNLGEGFAEAFAYYFGCPTSRAQMTEKAPNLAAFFERLRARDMTP